MVSAHWASSGGCQTAKCNRRRQARPERNGKLTMPNEAANALSVARAHGFVLRGQRTVLQHTRSSGAAVTGMVIKSLISRDAEVHVDRSPARRPRAMLLDL
jgi:hypothetical protein